MSISQELSNRSKSFVWIESAWFAVTNVIAFFGSLSVCFAVYRNQRLRTLANMFILALAVSDIMISIFSMPFSVATLVHGRWIFGAEFCQFQAFALFLFGLASLNTMGVIAVSRYFCVVKPEKYITLFTRKRIFLYISFVWFLALFATVPPLFFKEGGYQFQPGKAMCLYSFEVSIGYTVFLECVYLGTPLTLITICYAKVFYTVSRSNRVFSQVSNPQQLRANVEEAKVTKTLAAVMAGFSFCWLPICVIDYIDLARGKPTLPRRLYLVYGFLIYLSSTINPFIYGATNRLFRREYKAILEAILSKLPAVSSDLFRRSKPSQSQNTQSSHDQKNENVEIETLS